MANKWRVLRIDGVSKGKDFGVFRSEDVAGMASPIEYGAAPCMLANCSHAEAKGYVRRLERGESVENIRYDRQCLRNMMYSGMN